MNHLNNNTPDNKMPAAGKIIIAVGLVLLVVAAQHVFVNMLGWGRNREMRVSETPRGVTYDYNAGAYFYSFNAGAFYFCTQDGMQYVTSNGDTRWQDTFNFSKPIVAAHGEWLAVGEERGRRIIVYNGAGRAYGVTLDHPVLTFSINSNGHLAVVLQLESGYAVNVYNQRNYINFIFSNTIHDPQMIPVSASVSSDGRLVAIVLWDYGMRLSSRVVFYNLSMNNAWGPAGSLFAAYEFDQMAYHVRYMEQNKALVFTETHIRCFQPGSGNTMDEIWAVELHNKIHLLEFHSGNRFAFTAGERFLNDDKAAEQGDVFIFDMRGEQTGFFRLGRRATHLSMGHNSVVAGFGRSFYVRSHTGAPLWDYIATQHVRQFILLDNTETALMAGGTRAAVMRRVRVRTTENTADDFEGMFSD
jgi:hypothetical protein